jgi:hypothetical protein
MPIPSTIDTSTIESIQIINLMVIFLTLPTDYYVHIKTLNILYPSYEMPILTTLYSLASTSSIPSLISSSFSLPIHPIHSI